MDIQELRDIALRKHRAANKKVSRNRGKGVELGGSEFDVRKPAGKIKTMRSRDLQNYIKKLDGFVSRETQFVPDRESRPIPIQEWRQYKSTESRHGARLEIENAKVADKFIVESGMTVKQRHALMDPTKSQSGNPSVNAEWRKLNRTSKNIRSRKSLKDLENTLKRDLQTGSTARKIKAGRHTISEVAKQLGDKELQRRVNSLTNQQFWFLWNHTKFATDLTMPYEIHKKYYSPGEQASDNESIKSNMNKAMRQIDDAKKLYPKQTRTKK